MKLTIKVCAVILLLSTVVMAGSKKLKVAVEPGVDFSKYRTYAWVGGVPAANPIVDTMLIAAFDTELQDRGLQKVDPPQADIIVRYDVATSGDINAQISDGAMVAALGLNPMQGTGLEIGSGTVIMQTSTFVRSGSIVFDIFDKPQRKLVFQAVANGKIQENRSKLVDQVNRLIRAIFAEYPVPAKQ